MLKNYVQTGTVTKGKKGAVSAPQMRGSFEMELARYEQVPGNVASEIIAKHQAENQSAE